MYSNEAERADFTLKEKLTLIPHGLYKIFYTENIWFASLMANLNYCKM